MTRNLKALGLALAAVFALAAVGASAASAATDHFTAAEETALLTGVGTNHVFQLTGSTTKFECATSKFAATIENGDTDATVDVEYEGTVEVEPPHTTHCTSTAGALTVDMNGCDYRLTGETTQEDENETDAVVWIECPEEKEITLTTELVTIHIPPQTPTEKQGGVTYENIANHEESEKTGVKVTATATGITAECTPTFICGLGGIPTHTNAYDYNGTVNITGYEDNNEKGVITPAEEGSKIDIEVEST